MPIQRNFWDYLAWICLAGITIWLILKVLGIINTPLWLEYSPIFGAVYLAGWNMNKLERSIEDIKELKSEISIMKTKCSKII